MSRSKRPPPPKPPRPAIPEREVTSTGQRLPRPVSHAPIPDPEVEFRLPDFPTERPTGKRNENVSRVQQLVAIHDELDDIGRDQLVQTAHVILAAQNRRNR
jgi:hypothetical protein